MRDAGFFPLTASSLDRTPLPSANGTAPATPEFVAASTATADAVPASSSRAALVASSPSSRDARAFPLTEAQLEVWLGCQFAADASLVFNETSMVRLPGAVDVAALERAVRQVIERHEALRTTFSTDGRQQRVERAAAIDVPMPIVDLSRLDPTA